MLLRQFDFFFYLLTFNPFNEPDFSLKTKSGMHGTHLNFNPRNIHFVCATGSSPDTETMRSRSSLPLDRVLMQGSTP